jgi:hypothetical protein
MFETFADYDLRMVEVGEVGAYCGTVLTRIAVLILKGPIGSWRRGEMCTAILKHLAINMLILNDLNGGGGGS